MIKTPTSLVSHLSPVCVFFWGGQNIYAIDLDSYPPEKAFKVVKHIYICAWSIIKSRQDQKCFSVCISTVNLFEAFHHLSKDGARMKLVH